MVMIKKNLIGNIEKKDIDSEDDKIWRYMSIEKFLYLIMNRKLYMSQAAAFNDPYEGVVSDSIRYSEKSGKSEQEQEAIRDQYNKLQKKAKKCYVSCWHINKNENVAMWKLYADEKSGVAIQSKIGNLIKSMPCNDEKKSKSSKSSKSSMYLGKVKYMNFNYEQGHDYNGDDFEISEIVDVLFYKRFEFGGENELRLVKEYDSKTGNNGYEVDVNLEAVIEKIYVSPTAPEYYKNIVKGILEKYDYEFEVLQSSDLLKY